MGLRGRGSSLWPRTTSMSSNQPAYSEAHRDFGKYGPTPFGVGSGQSMDDAATVIKAVSELLSCPVRYVDANGYTHEITAGAVHPGIRAVASVHCKSKTLGNGYVDIE